MLAVDEPTREAGRRLIHQNKVTFDEWLKQLNANAEPDLGECLVHLYRSCVPRRPLD